MNLVEDIKASLLALKKDYPYGISSENTQIALNFDETETDFEFLDNVITKGFKLDKSQIKMSGTSEIVINFGDCKKFEGQNYTVNLKSLKEIAGNLEHKKLLWSEIQKILKMI